MRRAKHASFTVFWTTPHFICASRISLSAQTSGLFGIVGVLAAAMARRLEGRRGPHVVERRYAWSWHLLAICRAGDRSAAGPGHSAGDTERKGAFRAVRIAPEATRQATPAAAKAGKYVRSSSRLTPAPSAAVADPN
jgi:hypothetical protein